MLTLLDVLNRTQAFFKDRGIPSARLDAELILAHALGLERVQLYVQFERPLTEAELEALRPLVTRRGRREPLAWITGTKGFHAIELAVHPGVLVPRPDTETLVEAALAHVDPEADCYVADIGCGTGAVGLALAAARPRVRVYATDLSLPALANTRENVKRLGLESRVAVLRGSLLAPIPEERPVDLVVSNPPYVRSGDIALLAPEVREHEPRQALDGGPDGLAVYRQLVPAAVARARRAVLVEIGHDQADAVSALFAAAGLGEVRVHKDLGGRDRVVEGRAG